MLVCSEWNGMEISIECCLTTVYVYRDGVRLAGVGRTVVLAGLCGLAGGDHQLPAVAVLALHLHPAGPGQSLIILSTSTVCFNFLAQRHKLFQMNCWLNKKLATYCGTNGFN